MLDIAGRKGIGQTHWRHSPPHVPEEASEFLYSQSPLMWPLLSCLLWLIKSLWSTLSSAEALVCYPKHSSLKSLSYSHLIFPAVPSQSTYAWVVWLWVLKADVHIFLTVRPLQAFTVLSFSRVQRSLDLHSLNVMPPQLCSYAAKPRDFIFLNQSVTDC